MTDSEPNDTRRTSFILQDILAKIEQAVSEKDEQDFLVNLVKAFETGGKSKVNEILEQKMRETLSGVEKASAEIKEALKEVEGT
ncbi:MAG: hypothetical protein DRJ60_00900 [Thermoprotei archaeon]|nr:MAG: hypothetical protein DRJ60_00900 [Thermoprotei archaeon]